MGLVFSADEIQTIRKLLQLKTFELQLSSDWGSLNTEHRDLIYRDLNSQTKGLHCSSSISHSPSLGGYIFTQDSRVQVGFDIEAQKRVTPEVAKRICQHASEFESAPSPAALWTAKESAYKAIKGLHQPTVLSEIEVGNWGLFESQYETFQFSLRDPRSKFLNYGVVVGKEFYTFSFFAFST